MTGAFPSAAAGAIVRDIRAGGGDRLELLAAEPLAPSFPHPLLFLHGAFVGAWCWAEHFLPRFAEQGFACYALSFRGHGASRGRERLMAASVDDYVEDVFLAVGRIGRPPVLVGHSMGGFVAQKYLEDAAAPAAVLMAPVPPQGLLASQLKLAFANPTLFAELNHVLAHGRGSPQGLRKALFAGAVAPEKLDEWFRRTQPESQRAIWDMTLFALPWLWQLNRAPTLWLAAEEDALFPVEQLRIGAEMRGGTLEVVPGVGHAMMLDAGWPAAAERIAVWLRAQIEG
ncbi:MAG: alpha/beta hydrolase [Burkholderiales bacterium]|nr:alpha/beta hydrolase [Burkholderiales bacterium]